MIDLHTHFLPGADGCVATVEESLAIFKQAAAVGITDIVLSVCYLPHLGYTQSVAENAAVLEHLQEKIDAANLPVTLHSGNEILFDTSLCEACDTGRFKALGTGHCFLTEVTSDTAVYKTLLAKNYTPILANPERYASIQKDIPGLDALREMGVKTQGSLLSLIGHYGDAAQHCLSTLLKTKRIDCLATGARDITAYLNFDTLKEAALSIITPEEWHNLTVTTPRAFIR